MMKVPYIGVCLLLLCELSVFVQLLHFKSGGQSSRTLFPFGVGTLKGLKGLSLEAGFLHFQPMHRPFLVLPCDVPFRGSSALVRHEGIRHISGSHEYS